MTRGVRHRSGRTGSPWSSREEGLPLLAVLLWTLDRLRPVITAFGIDFPAFRELLRVRVLLALRPTRATSAWGAAGIVLAILMAWLAGLATGLLALLQDDPDRWVVYSQSALALMVATLFFQFLAAILVDPTDIGVVAPHPVSDRTIFATRLAEVFAHLLVFVAAFAAGNVLLAVFRQPPLAVLLVYPVLALLCAVTTLGSFTLVFAACLRIVGPARFQRVTLWAQVLGGAMLFALFQLPRVFELQHLLEPLHRLRYVWPPFHYAEVFALASGGREPALGACVAALLAPLAAFVITLALASRHFLAGLQGSLAAPPRRVAWPDGFLVGLGRLSRNGPERAGFDFTAALARREGHVLRAVLPQIAMFQCMAVGLGAGWERDLGMYLPASAGLLFIVLPNALMQSQATSQPDAGLLFASAPVEDPSVLLRGGLKALLLQWIGLPAVVLACVQLSLFGLGAVPRILLALELCFVTTLAFARRFELGLPFTRPIRVGESGTANFGLVLLSGFAVVCMVAAHFALSRHPAVLGVGLLVLAVILVRQWRGLDAMRIAREVPRRRRSSAPGG